ncbi:MAG: PhzF family phenazine biosynthesis protein [Bacteroidota bacterium]|nr:PhzF family phenazine biosynthesis protein [Bacteroidota bacterium]
MRKIKIRIVDAFTRTLHAGNPAGVVLDGEDLNEKQMQMIARELNLSETAFILPPTKPEADIRIRWFSPSTEVPLCGHATIASFHVLAEENKLQMENSGEYHFKVETPSGVLPVDIQKQENDISIMFGLPIPKLQLIGWHKVEAIRILNIDPHGFELKKSVVADDNLFVQVRRLHSLFTLKPNFVTLSYFLETRKLQGLCIFSTETLDKSSAVHSRYFAPNLGINEDPVTGSTHGALAVILYENGFIQPKDGICSFQAEQGDVIARPGRIHVQLNVEDNKPRSVKIGGKAIPIMEGDIIIDV